jgi:hypothetical protein
MKNWSHWNYRVYCDENGDYGFIETYYDDKENIIAYSEYVRPYGESIKDLELDLEKMAEALNKPTLFISDMPKG